MSGSYINFMPKKEERFGRTSAIRVYFKVTINSLHFTFKYGIIDTNDKVMSAKFQLNLIKTNIKSFRFLN